MKMNRAVTSGGEKGALAKRGYRVLPGSAIHEMGASITTPKVERAAMTTVMSPSPSTQPYRSSKADRVNFAEAAPPAKQADAPRSKPKRGVLPPKDVPTDRALSARHHKESIAFNEAHAREHDREAMKHKKALAKRGKR